MCIVADTFKKMKCAELAEALSKILSDESYESDLKKLRGNAYTFILCSRLDLLMRPLRSVEPSLRSGFYIHTAKSRLVNESVEQHRTAFR